MKIARIACIALGAAAVAAAAVTALAFVPAVQRWGLLRLAARAPGTTLTVGRLAIRPGACSVRDLRLSRPGLRLEADAVTADLSLWDAVVHRRLVVRNLIVSGLRVNPSPAAAAALPAGAAAPAVEGILHRIQPPWPVAIASCRIDAEIGLARDAAGAGRRLRVSLAGGRLAPGREAQFDFEAGVREPGRRDAVDEVAARGVLTVALDRESRLERVGARMAATANGPLLRAPARLEGDITLARKGAGESYSLALRSPETGAEGRLLDVAAAWEPGAPGLAGSWQIRLSRPQLAPFLPGAALPEFSVTGDGRFEPVAEGRSVRLTGRLTGDCGRLEILDPRLGAVGRLGATAAFDLEYGRGSARVGRCVLSLSGANPAVSLETIQPFSVELRTGALTAADPARELVRIGLEGVPTAWVRPFVQGIDLNGGELKGALAASLREGRIELRTTSALTVKGLALAAHGRALLPAGDLRIEAGLERTGAATRLRLDDLAVETAAGDRIDVRGELILAAGAAAERTARIEVTGVLPALLDGLLPIGPVQGRAAAACTLAGGEVRIDRLEAHLATPGGRPLADLTSSAPFRFDRARGLVAAAPKGRGEILRLGFGRLPVAVFQPWCGAWRLHGELQPGELRARSESAGLRITAAAPLRVTGFSLDPRGSAWVRDLVVEFEPAVSLAAGGMTAGLTALRVANADGAPVVSGHAEATFGSGPGGSGARVVAGFDVSIPGLAGQPLLGGAVPPSQGRLSGELTFTFDHDLLGEGRITLNGLVSPVTGEALPVANLSFRAGWNGQGTIAVQAPLLIDRAGERSDLTVAATVRPDGPHRRLEANISSQHFVIDDARVLVRAFRRPPAPEAAAELGGPPPAAAPAAAGAPPPANSPWAPLTGQVTLDIRSLVVDRNLEVTGLAGAVTVDPVRVAADRITGRLDPDGALQLGAELRFAAGAPEPFTARYDFQLRDCEIGPLFSGVAPNEPPALEGRFNVRSQAAGAGRTLAEVIGRTRGDYLLQSRKGIFRALKLPPPAPRAGGIVGGAARLIDNLGEKVGNLVSYDAPTQELAGLLTAFPYDQLNARLSRDAARNLVIADFTLVSPIVRLQGSGSVTYEAGKGMLERRLQLQLTMGVMGRAESMIAKYKSSALSGERDELGFMKLKESFAVTGTISRPEAGPLYSMLKSTLVQRILP